eukprot:TRINITY_DN28205_c0_g2_i6.p1 TRINITY_DN28205_c0_g2~~TRINITY_DN28205_c0_g2_i6.p1  ORF type:complete len:226 (-),score=33.86 TRINITY_DN28205_c0_g2_i6:169-846(-)
MEGDLQEVRPGLWLGSKEPARHPKILAERGVTHVLSLGTEFPRQLLIDCLADSVLVSKRTLQQRSGNGRTLLQADEQDPFARLMISVEDRIGTDISIHFDACREFIAEGVSKGGVFVHCWMGKSRSATAVVAYIMGTEDVSAAAALLSIQARRAVVQPNVTFMEQLRDLEVQLNITPASPRTLAAAGALTRKERLEAQDMQEIRIGLWVGSINAAAKVDRLVVAG